MNKSRCTRAKCYVQLSTELLVVLLLKLYASSSVPFCVDVSLYFSFDVFGVPIHTAFVHWSLWASVRCSCARIGVGEASNVHGRERRTTTNVLATLCASVRLYCTLIASDDRRGMLIAQNVMSSSYAVCSRFRWQRPSTKLIASIHAGHLQPATCQIKSE